MKFPRLSPQFAVFALAVLPGGWPAYCQTIAPVGSASLTYDLADHRVPIWNNSGLLVLQDNGTATPTIHVFDRSGRETGLVAFTIPDTSRMRIEGLSRAANNDILLCGVAYNKSGEGSGFIATIEPGSKSSSVVRTFPYVPYQVASAPDGTVWTEGLEMVNGREHHPSVDVNHGVIRQFDPSGHQLRSVIPRASIPEMLIGLASNAFASSRYGIAWYTDDVDRLTVVGFDGTVKTFPGVPGYGQGWVSGIAITDDGDVYVSGAGGRSNAATHERIEKPGLYQLRHDTGQWKVVTLASMPNNPVLYGAEGDTLVLGGKTRFDLIFARISE